MNMRRQPAGRSRKRRDPILMGEPSPALTKMRRMNAQELKEHAEALNVESDRITQKIAHLQRVKPLPEERILQLLRQSQRLTTLAEMAQQRLNEINEQQPRSRYQGRSFH